MQVEILHIDECPSWILAAERSREALDALGLEQVPVTTRLLRDTQEAGATAFAGSPTIVLDGQDAFPSEGRTAELACRVYPTGQGLAGSPTVEQLVDAIRSRL